MKPTSASCVVVCIPGALPAFGQSPSAPIDYDAVREAKVVRAIRAFFQYNADTHQVSQ